MKKEFALGDLIEAPKHVMNSTHPICGKIFYVTNTGIFVMFAQQPGTTEDTDFVPLHNLLRVISVSTGYPLFDTTTYLAILDFAVKEHYNSYRYFTNDEMQELINLSQESPSLDVLVQDLALEVKQVSFGDLQRQEMYNDLITK